MEVDSSLATAGRRGALRSIAREAEQQFGLVPGKYSFNSLQGKVDSAEKLGEAIQARTNGVCQLEVCEREDGRMMRETSLGMKALEERMVKRMEDALRSIRKDVEADLQNVATEQLALSFKIEELSNEAFESRIDVLKSEEELTERLASLTQDCLAMREDTLMGEEATTIRVDKLVHELQIDQPQGFLSELGANPHASDSIKQLEDLARELQEECDALSTRDLQANDDDCETLRAQVRALTEKMDSKPMAATKLDAVGDVGHISVPALAAMQQDLSFLQDPFSYSSKKAVAIPYSSKTFQLSPDSLMDSFTCDAGKQRLGLNLGYDAMTPFAHCTIAPKLRGCRSSPVLPALK